MDCQEDFTKNKLLDIRELSKYLNVKVGTIYHWIHERKIPHIKMNGLIRFDLIKINNWIEDNLNGGVKWQK